MEAQEFSAAEGRADRISRCSLSVGGEAWPFAVKRRAEIVEHWQRCRAARPKLFDGQVYLMSTCSLLEGTFTAAFLPTDFKSFLYWRDCGYPGAGARDGFGSSVIRSSEGHVLFGRQTSGNLNAGLVYPPGGFIDAQDVDEGGTIDIDASIARELGEETGLDPASLARTPGYVLTLADPFVSIAIEWRSPLPAVALREAILSHIRRQPVPELADIVIVRSPHDIDDAAMPAYARVMLRLLLSA